MAKEIDENIIKCPVETTIDVLAGKWKILILWYLKDEKKDLMNCKNFSHELLKRC
ncbi:MAG: hypothetical protein U5K55_08920 [Aliarcobacter sp.]|nr:hypothetical protein [Aliarcobacter sp.]